MTKATHTPGPWKVHGNRAIGTTEEDWQLIAYLDHHRNRRMWTEGEFSANARLIAAAPRLLAEAVELLRHATFADGQGTILTQDAEALEAAIAEATGG